MNVRFDEWRIDREALEVTRAGERVELAPMAVRLLLLLTDTGGEIVSREFLYETLWPDGFVDRPRLVNTYMRQIRAALGERAGDDVFIRTYPRRGYRFLKPVEVEAPHDGSTRASSPDVPARSGGRGGGRGTDSASPLARGMIAVLLLAVGALGLALVGPTLLDRHPSPVSGDRVAYRMAVELLAAPSPEVRAGSVPHFLDAIASDPHFAPAHAGLAEALFWAGRAGEAEGAAREALALDPGSARARLVLGSSALISRWAWDESERELRHALRAHPDDVDIRIALGFLLVSAGRPLEARAVLDPALSSEPVSAAVTGDLGMLYGWMGLHDVALELCRRTIAIDATASWGHECALEAGAALGLEDEVRERVGSLLELSGRDPSAVSHEETVAAGASGSGDPAALLLRLRAYQLEHSLISSDFERAVALSVLGRTAEAVAALEMAAENREMGIVAIAAHPAFQGLEDVPGYRHVRDRVLEALPATSAETQ